MPYSDPNGAFKKILLESERGKGNDPSSDNKIFHMSDLLKQQFKDETPSERSSRGGQVTEAPREPTPTIGERFAEQMKKDSNVPRVHTFQDDVNRAMKQGATISSIAAAEFDKKTPSLDKEEDVSSSKTKGVFMRISGIFIGIFLIGSGVFALYYFGTKFGKPFDDDTPPSRDTLLLSRVVKKISLGGKSRDIVLRDLQTIRESPPPEPGAITEFSLMTDGGNGGEIPANIFDLFDLLSAHTPSDLKRNSGMIFYGMIATPFGNKPFIVIETKDKDTVYSGMLSWERTLSNDIGQIFRARTDFDPTSTSTARGTLFPWSDRVVKNRDARVETRDDGEILLLYVFSNNTLIIAPNEDTIHTIAERLNSAQVVQ